jgi:hypothetical protein
MIFYNILISCYAISCYEVVFFVEVARLYCKTLMKLLWDFFFGCLCLVLVE